MTDAQLNPMSPQEIGNRLKTFLRQHDYTAREAATILGISDSYLSMVMNGRVPLSAELAKRLERRYGVNARTLYAAQALYQYDQTTGEIPYGKHTQRQPEGTGSSEQASGQAVDLPRTFSIEEFFAEQSDLGAALPGPMADVTVQTGGD